MTAYITLFIELFIDGIYFHVLPLSYFLYACAFYTYSLMYFLRNSSGSYYLIVA